MCVAISVCIERDEVRRRGLRIALALVDGPLPHDRYNAWQQTCSLAAFFIGC